MFLSAILAVTANVEHCKGLDIV